MSENKNSNPLIVEGLEDPSPLGRSELLSYLGELGLKTNHGTTVTTGELDLSGIVSTYEDMLEFAGPEKQKKVSMAFGALFRSGFGWQDTRLKDSGLELVDPEGKSVIDQDGHFITWPHTMTNQRGSQYEGWGVTLESLVRAVDTGSLHFLRDLERNNGSYKFFESYVANKLSELSTEQ